MEWMVLWMTFRGEWHLELFSAELRIKAHSLLIRGDAPPSFSHTHAATTQIYTHTKHGQHHTWTHSLAAWSYSESLNIQKKKIHLGFVALLCTQSRSRSVKLLGYDTQKLSLVLCSVTVRRADVDHLEREGNTDTERCTEKTGTETEGQSECQEELEITAEKTKSRREEATESRDAVSQRGESSHAWWVGCGRGEGGQPAVTQTAVDSTRSVFFFFTWGSSKVIVGQLLQDTVRKSKLCSMQWSSVPRQQERKRGLNVISRLKSGLADLFRLHEAPSWNSKCHSGEGINELKPEDSGGQLTTLKDAC